jgi:LysM repeat protein
MQLIYKDHFLTASVNRPYNPDISKSGVRLSAMGFPVHFLSGKITMIFLALGLVFFPGIGTLKAQNKTHKVQSGETLSSLSKKYKTTVQELQRLNPELARGLKAGAELIVPGQKKEKESVQPPQVTDGNGGKTHKVRSGESLSAIARKYKVRVQDLEIWNSIKANQLKAGQEILVSAPEEPVSGEVSPPKEQKNEDSEFALHTVGKGETLSSIARANGHTVSELRQWNDLKGNGLKLGQTLKVRKSKNDITSPKTEAPKLAEPAKPEPVESKTAVAVVPQVAEQKVSPPANPLPVPAEAEVKTEAKPMVGIREVNNTLGYTRVVETGFAEAIDGDGNSKKHLCLHKTAPIGSILQVRNEMNGQSVFVKVVGKLPETGSNEKLIIRISRQAYDRLMATGKRFPVEVSYPESAN